ncbi:MAG: VCBS repeat-containing protein, partial [Verrucomicrobiota bacterium]
GNTLTVLTNNGSGGFGSNATYTVGDRSLGIGIYYVAAADVNGDGKPDLISTKNGSGTLSVLTNDGSGGFVLAASPAGGGGASVMVMAADVNNDGKVDLICATRGSGTLSVLINTTIFPSPTSTPSLSINPSGNGMSVSWPSASAGWSLQQNSDLTTTHWGPSGYSGYTISDDGTNKSLVIPSQPGNLFFRLLHP